MQAIRVLEKTGKDGALSLRVPLGQPDTEFEVLVVVQLHGAAGVQDRDWPAGYFDKTFGSIDDDTFERPPQGELPQPPVLD
ncbi:MAG: hypothetical protein ACJ8F7_07950 [Gemmataceae bacterium]